MRRVLSGVIIQPSEAELEAFYQANLERYRTPPTLDTDEIVFNSRETLPRTYGVSSPPARRRNPSVPVARNPDPLPNVNRLDCPTSLMNLSLSKFNAEIGPWEGPFLSNRVSTGFRSTRTESVLPSLGEIRDRVRLEWIAMEEDQRLQTEIEQLWEQYTIRILNDNSVH